MQEIVPPHRSRSLTYDSIEHIARVLFHSLLSKTVLSAALTVMTIGVAPLEIIVALFTLEGGRAPSFAQRAHRDPGDVEL